MDRQYYISTFTSALLLFFLGLLLLVLIQGRQIISELQQSARCIVEMAPDVDQTTAQSVRFAIAEMEQVDATTVEYVTKEQALSQMGDEETTALTAGDSNPFLDIIIFSLSAKAMDATNMEVLKAKITELSGVQGFYHEMGFWEEIRSNFNKITLILAIIALLFIVLVVVLMHNVIRLMLYHRREELEIMDLVGATPGFIRAPFLHQAIKNGWISGGIAVIGIGAVATIINLSLSGISAVSWISILIVAFCILLLGLAVSTISTYIIVNLYLKRISNI